MFGAARTALLLGVGLGFSAVVLIAYGVNALGTVELRSVEARFAVRGTRAPPADVAMVAVDRATTLRMGRVPLARSKYARVLDHLRAAGASVIMLPIQFAGRTSPREDAALYEALTRAGNVVLSSGPQALIRIELDGRIHATPRNLFAGQRKLRAAHALVGSTFFIPDPDGLVRRVPFQAGGFKSLPVVAAERASGRPVTRASLNSKSPFVTGSPNPLFASSGSSAWIDFYGPRGTIPATPFWRVAAGRFPRGLFTGKVVVIGLTVPEAQDTVPTGVDRRMSRLELEVNSVATALHGFPLQDSPRWLDVALVLLLGLVPALTSLVLRARWVLLFALVAFAVYVVAVQFAFDQGLMLPFLYPVAALAVTTLGVVPARYVTESFEHARGLFQRFVPESFALSAIAERQDIRQIPGETLDATVMFADLRAFTAYAESLPPNEVIGVVNRYLQEMSDSILDHGGTVVSYFGDGIMAAFGAPNRQSDHAERALATAADMLEVRLARFNEWLASKNYSHAFELGIGLNSGPVISGTVGSERRLEYAAIGDTTNTAARLQAMTKETGTPLVIAKATRDRLSNTNHALERIGALTLRGREGKIEAWTLRPTVARTHTEAPHSINTPG